MGDIHLVWNSSARGSLSIALKNEAIAVCFGADPSIGPLDDPELRIEFFQQLYAGCGLALDDQSSRDVMFSVAELKNVIRLSNAKRVIIWTSNCGSDHIFLRMCVWYLQTCAVEIWSIKVPPRDDILNPFKSVAIFTPENLCPLVERVEPIDEGEQKQLRSEFEKYIMRPEPLRMLEADGSVSFHELSYLDQHILLRCSRTWRKAARVIAEALGYFDPRNPKGDLVFLLRLRALIACDRLEVAGDIDNGMGFFEVRLPQISK